jgi:hypothetical protein
VAQQYPVGGKKDPEDLGPDETSRDVMGSDERDADALPDSSEGSGTIEQRIEEVKEKARNLNPEPNPQPEGSPGLESDSEAGQTP